MSKRVLNRLGFRPSKRRGQNFLHSPAIVHTIVDFAQIAPEESVLEIGPGLGALTSEIIGRCRRFLAVEIEPQLCEYLLGEVPGLDERQLIQADVRALSLDDYRREAEEKFVVVSNVPYSVSSEVVQWIIANRRAISRASLLLQREFAERLAASPGGKDYGSLTVFCRFYSEVSVGPCVGGDAFYPAAEVESRLVRLQLLDKPRVEVADEEALFGLVRASFATRRKTLLNCLGASRYFPSKQAAAELLESVGIDSQRRAETLSLEEFARLANAWSALNKS